MKRHYDLVEITWDDATDLEPGWTDKVAPGLARPFSSGYLIYEDADYIILAMDCDGTEHNSRGQYPRGMIKNIEVLKKKDADSSAI